MNMKKILAALAALALGASFAYAVTTTTTLPGRDVRKSDSFVATATTEGTATAVLAEVATDSDTVYALKFDLLVRDVRTGDTDQGKGEAFVTCVEEVSNKAGTVTLTPASTPACAETEGDLSATAPTVALDGTNVQIVVTGTASETLKWKGIIRVEVLSSPDLPSTTTTSSTTTTTTSSTTTTTL